MSRKSWQKGLISVDQRIIDGRPWYSRSRGRVGIGTRRVQMPRALFDDYLVKRSEFYEALGALFRGFARYERDEPEAGTSSRSPGAAE